MFNNFSFFQPHNINDRNSGILVIIFSMRMDNHQLPFGDDSFDDDFVVWFLFKLPFEEYNEGTYSVCGVRVVLDVFITYIFFRGFVRFFWLMANSKKSTTTFLLASSFGPAMTACEKINATLENKNFIISSSITFITEKTFLLFHFLN